MPSRPSVLALIAVVGVAGCGGSTKSKPAIGQPGTFTAKAGLLGTARSAGAIKSYAPTGKIIADSGFRATVNGFAFETYGNNAGPVNLTPVNVEHLFGPQVCATGEGASCRLVPSAKQWMEQENVSMANGHCMGFSVTALRFFSHNLSPSNFGAGQPISLPVQGNTTLQSTIAEDFAYQYLSSVRHSAIAGTPAQVLRSLVSALNRGKDAYTLAILKADGTGGHAITPFVTEKITVNGAGVLFIVANIHIVPGQKDTLLLPNDDLGLTYASY